MSMVDLASLNRAANLHEIIDKQAPNIANRVIGPPTAFFKLKQTAPSLKPLEVGGDQVPEVTVINRAIESIKAQVATFAPRLVEIIEAQRPLVYATAMAFKASILTANKTYAMNPTAGSLGVSPLFPYALKPTNATPSGYQLNSWNISLTANTAAFLLGSPTAFYIGQTTPNATTWYYIFANGLVEIGSTPSIEQIKIISQEKQAISPYYVGPFVDVPVNKDYPAYIYPLPGFYIDNQSQGLKLSVLPRRTGVADLRLIGLVFYEYDFFKDFVTAT
ncbi:MAG: hypothetical protein QXF17_06740 [Ignisphaera sp.]